MNNNKVFETDKIFTQHLGPALKPKDKTDKCRVAKVGAGVVILPDNGSPISAKEIVKALGLKDVELEVEKEKRTKVLIDSEYNGDKFFISLTDSQYNLMDWLETHGIITEWKWEILGDTNFEEI